MSLSLHDITEIVAGEFGVTVDQIKGYDRTPEVAEPRHAAAYLCFKHSGKRKSQIARFLCRDHTTICHSIGRAMEIALRDEDFAKSITRAGRHIKICERPQFIRHSSAAIFKTARAA